MQARLHRNFRKQFKKLPQPSQAAFERRLGLFIREPFAQQLNNHGLSGEWEGYRSINVTGDVRAIYMPVDKNDVIFMAIGTHHELYG